MKKTLAIIAAGLLLMAGCVPNKEELTPEDKPQVDTPIEFAADSIANVAEFSKVVDNVRLRSTEEIHALLVVKDGQIVYQWYEEGQDRTYMRNLWSASKSVTALAVGFAVQDKLFRVDDLLIDFFDKDELPEQRPYYLMKLTIKNLLQMSSGFAEDILGDVEGGKVTNPSVYMLNSRMSYQPGTTFSYNSMNAYMLSAVITKKTGKTMEEYLDEKLFQPLGIKQHIWEKSAEGYNMGGWGLHITTESMAKLGQFCIQKGKWGDEQLLKASWFNDMLSEQTSTATINWGKEYGYGYGYQIWGMSLPGCWRFDGAWGQEVILIPDKNAVVVTNAHQNNLSPMFADIWKYIYPGL